MAVVTGAGGGIGRATSVLLAQRGCHLALVDVNEAALSGTAELVTSFGRTASTHVADVSNAARMEELPGEVVDAHGGCHVLVNNAGVTSAGRLERESLEDLHWIVGINVWGVIYGCKFFLPLLREADEAHIVNLSSMAGLLGLPRNASYSMTKGAVRTFTEALRSELITTDIGVTSVHPGAINTAIAKSARGAEGSRLANTGSSSMAPFVTEHVLRQPEDVARKIVRAIELNRARTLVGFDAHILDISSRLLPGRSGLIGRLTALASSRSARHRSG